MKAENNTTPELANFQSSEKTQPEVRQQTNSLFIFLSAFFFLTTVVLLIMLLFSSKTKQVATVSPHTQPEVTPNSTTIVEESNTTQTANTFVSSDSSFSFTVPDNWTAYEYDNNSNISNSRAVALRPESMNAPYEEFGVITLLYLPIEAGKDLDQFIISMECPQEQTCKIDGDAIMLGTAKAQRMEGTGGPLPSENVYAVHEGIGYRFLMSYDVAESFDPEVPGSEYKTETGKENEKIFTTIVESFTFL